MGWSELHSFLKIDCLGDSREKKLLQDLTRWFLWLKLNEILGDLLGYFGMNGRRVDVCLSARLKPEQVLTNSTALSLFALDGLVFVNGYL